VVREKLAALPAESNAVGATSTISGDIYLTEDGLHAGQTSSFKVDLRTLRSDESRRDNFITGTTLQANRFPFAEFVLEKVTGWPANYAEGTEVTLTLTGSMTIKGVTKQVTWDVKAAARATPHRCGRHDVQDDRLRITPPDVTLAKAQDGVQLQVVLVAKQPAT
jgi:polyisoprenoid-binding protein YceI